MAFKQKTSKISEISEPPSRRSQSAVVEALTIAAVDGNYFSFFCMLCGYSRSPLMLLILAELFILSLVALSEPTTSPILLNHLSFAKPEVLSILFAMAMQGVGYCFAEIAHSRSSKYIKRLVARHNRFLALLVKNVLLITLCALAQIFVWSPHLGNFFYGCLYAAIIGTVQEIIATTPVLKKLVAMIAKHVITMFSVITNTTQCSKKYAVAALALILFLATGQLCAWSTVSSITSCLPSVIIYVASLVAMFEQIIVYEYAYRATSRGYQKVLPLLGALRTVLMNHFSYNNNIQPKTPSSRSLIS